MWIWRRLLSDQSRIAVLTVSLKRSSNSPMTGCSNRFGPVAITSDSSGG
jgi:hypothetical protein